MLLLRAEAGSARSARARLEAAAPCDATMNEDSGLATLGMVLYGRRAVEVQQYPWVRPEAWLFTDDDPDWVADAVCAHKGEQPFDVRGAWLGGERALEH